VSLDPAAAARNSRIKQLVADIEALNREIARKEEDDKRLRANLEALQSRIEQVPGIESEWIALTRDYDTHSAKYKELLAKSENAQLATNLEEQQIGERFNILDPARTPVRPQGANRFEINAMGAALGLGIGLLLAAMLELMDRTFRRADDVVEVLKLPVIALVPRVVSAADRHRTRMKKALAVAAAAVLLIAGGYGFWVMRLWNYVV
jgi:uncharacterized protein involved in exopolysaccharide biosynthesis